MNSKESNTPIKDSASQERFSKPYSEKDTVQNVQSLFEKTDGSQSSPQKRPVGNSEDPADKKKTRISGQASEFNVDSILGRQNAEESEHSQKVEDLLDKMQFFLDNRGCPELKDRGFVRDAWKLFREIDEKVAPGWAPVDQEEKVESDFSGSDMSTSFEDVGSEANKSQDLSWMLNNRFLTCLNPSMTDCAKALQMFYPPQVRREDQEDQDQELQTVNQCVKDGDMAKLNEQENLRKRLLLAKLTTGTEINYQNLADCVRARVGTKTDRLLTNVLFGFTEEQYMLAIKEPLEAAEKEFGRSIFDRMLKFALWDESEVKEALIGSNRRIGRRFTKDEHRQMQAVFQRNQRPDDATLEQLAIKFDLPLIRVRKAFSGKRKRKTQTKRETAARRAAKSESELFVF